MNGWPEPPLRKPRNPHTVPRTAIPPVLLVCPDFDLGGLLDFSRKQANYTHGRELADRFAKICNPELLPMLGRAPILSVQSAERASQPS